MAGANKPAFLTTAEIKEAVTQLKCFSLLICPIIDFAARHARSNLGNQFIGNLFQDGKQFPDTEEEFRDIDSKILLEKTINMIRFYGYEISNIDSTVCLQKPKISTYVPKMIKTLSDVLHIDGHQISIKATTTEKMGFVGEEQGISAYALVLLVLS